MREEESGFLGRGGVSRGDLRAQMGERSWEETTRGAQGKAGGGGQVSR